VLLFWDYVWILLADFELRLVGRVIFGRRRSPIRIFHSGMIKIFESETNMFGLVFDIHRYYYTLSLREGHRQRTFEERSLRKMCVSKKEKVTLCWKKIRNV